MKKSTAKSSDEFRLIEMIVSGGQTGVDRAALDAALDAGVPIGGWCPRGRRAERGLIPKRYPLKETTARSYAVRTELNVQDSDGTLIIVLSEIGTGTRMTLDFAKRFGKPLFVVHLRPASTAELFSDQISLTEQLDSVVDWIREHRIRILNVAGPRGSSHKDIYPESREFVSLVLQRICGKA